MILAAMVVIGILLFITDKAYFRHHHSDTETPRNIDDENTDNEGGKEPHGDLCCGQHLVCEKTSLAITSDEVVYYDDEELDRFSGRTPESYSSEEAEEFRDVLLTLLPQDVAGWARSITLRRIELPPEVKDELLMLVSEQRQLLSSENSLS